jgi:hypothetical protein
VQQHGRRAAVGILQGIPMHSRNSETCEKLINNIEILLHSFKIY